MILYGLSTCDTTKKALKALQKAGKDVVFRDVRAQLFEVIRHRERHPSLLRPVNGLLGYIVEVVQPGWMPTHAQEAGNDGVREAILVCTEQDRGRPGHVAG